MLKLMEKLYRSEEGQGLVEYALILALIAVVVMVAVKAVGQSALVKFNEVDAELQ